MDERAIDMSAIELDAERGERLVAAIMARVEPELARRRASTGVLGLVALWRGPIVAASMLITVLSLAALLLAESEGQSVATAPRDLYDALELDQPVRRWLAEGRGPTTVDLVTVVEDAGP